MRSSAWEEHRRRCVHYFDGDCTRFCSRAEQFRPCSGGCPRMRRFEARENGLDDESGRRS